MLDARHSTLAPPPRWAGDGLLVAGSGLLVLAVLGLTYGYWIDDTFIYGQFARNLARGLGFTYPLRLCLDFLTVSCSLYVECQAEPLLAIFMSADDLPVILRIT